ncbi:MATE family efflux transporter [Anaerococcus porci]|uniref:MATE family efflux transporter n=1 Tax=Anaerococcus porci TaxID=2652269 RepID=UPI002A752EF5|nr:MATE family efflux transporter [Anaerococcus porci]MDY3006136.1 MATE family efflux transporter [Anaerococcus porci]
MNYKRKDVLKKMALFSIPYLISILMQALYGMADLFIVGQFNGVESITGVSIGSQVMHMITVMIIGLAMGTTVLIGKAVGSGRKDEEAKIIANTVNMFFIFSIIITIILLYFLKSIVYLMSTPKDAISETIHYLRVCFLGIPFIVSYNVISSIFRGKGDSKTPMYFVAIACVSNIILDFILIGVLGMGAMGAALGTVLSQAVSVIVSIIFMMIKDMGIKVKKSDFIINNRIIKELLKTGVPISLQDGFIQISFLLISLFANLRGIEDAAAVGIVEKIIGILFLVPSTMLSTVSALSAQYLGGKRIIYARKTLKYAILLCFSFCLISFLLMQFVAEDIVGLFTSDKMVIIKGGQYMRGYAFDCVLAGIHFCFSGYFFACKKSFLSFFHNCVSIICARIPISYFASIYFKDTLFPMGLAPAVGSLISVIICLIAYKFIKKDEDKLIKKELLKEKIYGKK